MEEKVITFKVSNSFIKNQCYLIYKNKEGILIDPAWEYHTIEDYLVQNNIVLKAVLLTHSHIDHTNLANKFAVQKNVPVYMSGIEIDAYNFHTTNLKCITHLTKIVVGTFEIRPLITPGHTVGSTCYLIGNHLFSGDTAFIEGVGTCNRKDCYTLFHSVQFLKAYLDEETLFWPGHSYGESPGKDLNHLLKNNIYFQFEKIEHFVDFRTRKNRPDPFLFE